MAYTLGEAAKAVGKSKATISKALKSGKMTGTKNPDGSYTIDPSELHRVYPPATPQTVQGEQSETPTETHTTPKETVELIELRVKLEAAQQRIADLQEDRDHWRQQANRLLSSPARSEPPVGFSGAKSLWKRLLG